MLFTMNLLINLCHALEKALTQINVGVGDKFLAELGAEIIRRDLVVGLPVGWKNFDLNVLTDHLPYHFEDIPVAHGL